MASLTPVSPRYLLLQQLEADVLRHGRVTTTEVLKWIHSDDDRTGDTKAKRRKKVALVRNSPQSSNSSSSLEPNASSALSSLLQLSAQSASSSSMADAVNNILREMIAFNAGKCVQRQREPGISVSVSPVAPSTMQPSINGGNNIEASSHDGVATTTTDTTTVESKQTEELVLTITASGIMDVAFSLLQKNLLQYRDDFNNLVKMHFGVNRPSMQDFLLNHPQFKMGDLVVDPDDTPHKKKRQIVLKKAETEKQKRNAAPTNQPSSPPSSATSQVAFSDGDYTYFNEFFMKSKRPITFSDSFTVEKLIEKYPRHQLGPLDDDVDDARKDAQTARFTKQRRATSATKPKSSSVSPPHASGGDDASNTGPQLEVAIRQMVWETEEDRRYRKLLEASNDGVLDSLLHGQTIDYGNVVFAVLKVPPSSSREETNTDLKRKRRAEEADEVIGCVSYIADENVFWLCSLVVKSRYQGQGVGQYLHRFATTVAQYMGVSEMIAPGKGPDHAKRWLQERGYERNIERRQFSLCPRQYFLIKSVPPPTTHKLEAVLAPIARIPPEIANGTITIRLLDEHNTKEMKAWKSMVVGACEYDVGSSDMGSESLSSELKLIAVIKRVKRITQKKKKEEDMVGNVVKVENAIDEVKANVTTVAGGSEMASVETTAAPASPAVVFYEEVEEEIVSLLSMKRFGWLTFLATDPTFRNTGIGSFMMHCGLEWLRRQGIGEVLLTPLNLRSARYYKKWAFDTVTASGEVSGDAAADSPSASARSPTGGAMNSHYQNNDPDDDDSTPNMHRYILNDVPLVPHWMWMKQTWAKQVVI